MPKTASVRLDAIDPNAEHHPRALKLRTGEVLYVKESHPDSLGRISFSRYWLTDYRPGHPVREYCPDGRLLRGQCFFSVLERYTTRDQALGLKVLVEAMA